MISGSQNENGIRQLLTGFQQKAPVNLRGLAEHLGISVWEMPNLPETISGKIFRDTAHGGASGYSIGVNAREGYTRKRFTLAHEIAHFLLHKSLIGDGIQDDALYRSELSGPQEVEANRLAADILMPYHLIRSMQTQGVRDVNALAQKLEVSVVAMKIRLGIPIY
jgi:predicted transcriptional regulator